MTSSQKQALKAWIAALLWIGLIAIESTDSLSSAHTSRFLYPILHFFTGVDHERFEVWNGHIRKTGHFVGYGTLSVLLFFAWRTTLRIREASAWAWRWAATAFLMSALVASLDEWHQSYIPSRTGTIWDVLLDSSAALTAQLLIALFLIWRRPASQAALSSKSLEVGSLNRAGSRE